MTDPDIETTWALGDDYDCDTCGSTYNEAGLELYDEENNLWQLYYSVGCYTGESILIPTDTDWETRADAMIAFLARDYSGFTEDDEKDLRNRIDDLTKKTTRP